MCQVGSVNKGSCEGCEARCGMVFRPVCSGDQATVYANKCQAECAGVTDTTECQVDYRDRFFYRGINSEFRA